MKKKDNKEERTDTNNGSRKNSSFLIYRSSYNSISYIDYTEEKF